MRNKELGTGLVNYQEAAGLEIGGVMRYPVNLKKDGKFFLATFPDIPEAITQGVTREEALQAAQEALETALDFYFDDQRTVPIRLNLGVQVHTVLSLKPRQHTLSRTKETRQWQRPISRKY